MKQTETETIPVSFYKNKNYLSLEIIKMEGRRKKENQLINKTKELHQQIIRLKKSENKHRKMEEKLKESEKALRQSHQEFASIFKNNPEAIAYIDNQGTILDINSCFTKLFGYNLKEIQGKNINEGMIHPSDKIEEAKYLFKKALSNDHYVNYETIRKKKDGTLFSVLVSGSSVVIDGESKGRIISYKDITERKQNEKLQQVLYNISKAAISDISLNQLYKTIHQELSTVINATNFHFALLNKKENKICFDYFVDEKDDISATQKYDNYGTLSSYVISTGQPLLINRKQINEMIGQGKLILSQLGTLTEETLWLGVPLKIKDKIIGVMAVLSYTNPNLYTKKDISLMEFISEQVATVIQRKQLEEQLKKLAHYDYLTGACNRGYGLSLLNQQIKLAHRKKQSILLVYLDIDGFKDINDTFGHKEGDKVLIDVVKLFKSTLREIDIICRMGGDEFILIFPDSSLKDLPIIKERLNKNLTELNKTLKKSYKLGFSIGISYYNPDKPQSVDELISIADESMYKEKKKNNEIRSTHLTRNKF